MSTPTITLTFEEGTNGGSMVAGGNYAAVSSPAETYSTAAAKHGSLGVNGSGTSSTPTFTVTRSASFTNANKDHAFSLYINPQAVSGGALQLVSLQNSANSVLGVVRCHSNGHFDIQVGASAAATTTLSWTAGTWYRLDCIYTGSSNSLTVNVFAGANVEGTVADGTITATLTTQTGGIDHWVCSSSRSTTSGCNGYLDTVRFYDGAVTPDPYAPTTNFSGSLGTSGGGALTLSTVPALSASLSLSAAGALALSTPGSPNAFTGSLAVSGSGALALTDGSVLLTFEEGTDGAYLPVAGAVTAVGTTPPNYAATAAVHGSLGVTGNAVAQTFTVAKPSRWTSADTSFSVYCTPRAVPSSAVRVAILRNSANSFFGAVRFHSDGQVDISGSTGLRLVATTGLNWTAGTRYRLDCVYVGATNTLTVGVYAGLNDEGSVADQTISATLTTQTGGWASILWSPSNGNVAGLTVDLDTVRVWDGQIAIAPYARPAPTLTLGSTGTLTLSSGSAFSGSLPLTAAGSLSLAAPTPGATAHLWQGAPSSSGFSVKAHTTGCTSVKLAVSTSSGMTSPTLFGPATPDSAGYVNLTAAGLAAGTRFYYQLQDTPAGGAATMIGSVGRARTGPAGNSHKIAFGSCITTNETDPTALNDVVTWDPDLFVFLGDFDYSGDSSTDPNHQRLTMENQIAGAAGLSALVRDVPWAMCTSDHDAGPDNGDSNNAYTAANIVAYQQIVPTYPLADTRSPTVGRYQTWVMGRVRYILLDIRNTDRSPGANTDDASKTMLGATQKAWLKAQLVQPEPVKVIISDVAWLGPASITNGADKWWSYSTERQELANYITANKVKCLLWHGDTHSLAVATPAKNTWGGFPVYCSSPMRNTGGGLNLSSFSSFWNNAGGSCANYARVTVTDDGQNITFAYVGWDAAGQASRVTQTDTFAAPSTPTGTLTLGSSGQLAVSGSGNLTDTLPLSGGSDLQLYNPDHPTLFLGSEGVLSVSPRPGLTDTLALTSSGLLTFAATGAVYVFTGPVQYDYRPFQIYPPTRLVAATAYGETVWRNADGTWDAQYAPTTDQLAGALVVYEGGHTYPLTDQQRSDLIAAGFGPYITEEALP